MSGDERVPDLLPRADGLAGPGTLACPACTRPIKSGAHECAACRFTGSDTFAMFPGQPPPLLPVLDAADMLDAKAMAAVEAATAAMGRRFPQFHWRVCTVRLPHRTSLPLFGFWLLNACPLHANESVDDREWSVLLLIDAGSGQAAVIPGYSAEPYISDSEWKSLLATMTLPWQLGDAAGAVTAFFKATRRHLERAWKRHDNRRPAPADT